MTTVLFLDVDGVLNHRACFQPSRGGSPLCPMAVKRLQRVVEVTGCRVVLSSTWRMLGAHVDKLKAAGGFPRPHRDWRTVQLPVEESNGVIVSVHQRGDEIAEWLSRHPEVKRYAIVDDDTDMLPEQEARFVRTSFEAGLLDVHAARLIDLLAGPHWVEVCPSCLTASCRQGAFRCLDAGEACETRTMGELAMLDREHPHYWEGKAST